MCWPGRAIARFGRLSWTERQLLAEAALLLPLVHVLQQKLPFQRWRSLLETMGSSFVQHGPSVAQVVRAVERAQRVLPGEYRCLPLAHATHVLLRRHGFDARVHVGVRHDASGKVEAHAWVECDGRTVLGLVDNMERFVPFPTLEPRPS